MLAVAPCPALADTLTIAQYRTRLSDGRAELARARSAPATQRAQIVATVQSVLRRTDHVTLASGESVVIDDSELVIGIDTSDASLDAAIARIEVGMAIAARIGTPAVDAASADARLREVLAKAPAQTSDGNLLEAFLAVVSRFLSGLQGPAVDLRQIYPALALLGLTFAVFIVAVLGRALPERIRREVLVRGVAAEQRIDPMLHLRAADAAIAASRARDAIHSLFLYAITALADREVIRYDPALTDRELIVRAAGIPHAESFRDLVSLYERSWFGLREPSVDEARRARESALRVAP